MAHTTTTTEQIPVTNGRHLKRRVKELLHEGNLRRIVIKNASGDTVAEVPVTLGVVGLLAAPSMATIGALVGVAAGYAIEVERETPAPAQPGATTPA
jgi:hypothetical protein